MSRARSDRLSPVDPLWYVQAEVLHLRCTACGRLARARVAELAQRGGLGGHHRLRDLVERLRCTVCGARRATVERD